MKNLFILLLIVFLIISGCNSNSREKKTFQNGLSNLNKEQINNSVKVTSAIELDSTNIKCNTHIILQTLNHIDSLTLKEMSLFLKSFSRECSNNAEFSEFSNEVLFKILEKQPSLFIKAMCLNDKTIEYSDIYLELSSPLSDLSPLDTINKIFKSSTHECSQLDSVKKYLNIAIEK